MKKLLLAFSLALLPFAGVAYAEPMRDTGDLDAVHNQVQSSIAAMERARAANHYDMGGHGAKAEGLLRQAERELKAATEAAKKAK
ncbi:MAG: hypothetical protein J2P49_02845 [Methylocapsa sp.]|nr:hypothetical protein [Methylocapsa sp.]